MSQQLLNFFLAKTVSPCCLARPSETSCGTFLQRVLIFSFHNLKSSSQQLQAKTAPPCCCLARRPSETSCATFLEHLLIFSFFRQQLQAKTAPPCCLALPSETVRQCHPSPVRQVVLLAVLLFSSPAQRDSETIMPPEQCKQMHLKEQCV